MILSNDENAIAEVSLANMPDYAAELRRLARETDWFYSALCAVRELRLEAWCIGAGAIRNLVWDALHAYPTRSQLADMDVVFFDNRNVTQGKEAALTRQLENALPGIPWEVTNQATVHHWFESHFGHPVEPLHSLEEAVASWPEFATAVGIYLSADDTIEIIAPYGLSDLFEMIVRRNPARVSLDTYLQRIKQKQYAGRWPKVRVIA